MPREKRIKAVRIPDDASLPSSPEELAQAIFKLADRKLAQAMEEEPYGSAGPGEGRKRRRGNRRHGVK